MATQRATTPRRQQVNELVAAVSNTNQTGKPNKNDPFNKSPSSHNSSFPGPALGSSPYNNFGQQSSSSLNILGQQHTPSQPGQSKPLQFPYTNGPPSTAHLTGAQKLSLMHPTAAGNTAQYVIFQLVDFVCSLSFI